MKKVTMDGNKACSNVAYLFSEVVGMYPITPSTPMAENIDKWSIKNRPNIFGDRVEIVEMQSEAGASPHFSCCQTSNVAGRLGRRMSPNG